MRFSDRYSAIERAIHHVAFAAPFVQKALAELENDLYSTRLGALEQGREVFITGLPRAGTTLLLELLYATGEFGTFTYRHMPFVLAPLLFSRAKADGGRDVERAHGDGMRISVDSPEAFEEVVWLAYLREQIVTERCLEPVTEVSREFESAFRATIRKLLAERGDDRARYLSKNNANISRLGVLSQLFPDSTIVVAFRNPLAHTASLMRQHARFLAAHNSDAFARRYMAWIGHFEFGANFRPINFSGWLDSAETDSPPSADFWLRYWIAAYEHALAHRTRNVLFVDFDRLLAERGAYLAALGRALRLRRPRSLFEQARRLRPPTTNSAERAAERDETLRAARAVHARLAAIALPTATDRRAARATGAPRRNS
jgi:hypothetical protein